MYSTYVHTYVHTGKSPIVDTPKIRTDSLQRAQLEFHNICTCIHIVKSPIVNTLK